MQKKQTILVVASLLVVVLSVTLAYFTAQIIGKGKDVSVSSADLKIIFTDSDGSISGSNIEPGWTTSKKFTVTNKSNETYKYNIVIQDLVNTFVTEGYLQYKITSTNSGYNMAEFKDVPKSSTVTDKVLAYSASIDVGVTQTYTIEFIYRNDESVDQNVDQNKELSGKLFISIGTEEPTLYNKILADNPKRGTRTFGTEYTEDNTNTLFTSTESINGSTPADVYYFAGNSLNNWVKFGTFESDGPIRGYESATSYAYKEYTTLEECNSATSYNTNCSYAWRKDDQMYWRIIRTNHDGSVRLLYHEKSTVSTTAYIGESKFNETDNDPMYVGYKYGTTGSLENNRLNTNDSTIKTYIDNWYKNNLTSYTKYLSKDAVYCNDRNLASGQTYSTTESFYYAPAYRDNLPSYNCTNISDAFSVNNEKAKLNYPIALMTVDEIFFAGGLSSTSKTWYYYNSDNTNSSTGSNTSSITNWKLMSPSKTGCVYIVYNGDYNGAGNTLSGTPFNVESVDVPNSVRPVISIDKCAIVKSGDGSPSNPYEIDYDNSNC